MSELRLTPAAIAAAASGDWENALIAATPGGIEAQEAAGQRDFVASETLPKKCLYCEREQLEAMGIIFGEDADDLLVRVLLPEGWKKVPTSHSMWSHLVDEKGRPLVAPDESESRDYRRPFVARELSAVLPLWEAAAYLTDPGTITSRAEQVARILWVLISILFVSILVG